jgi:hypothetical protein
VIVICSPDGEITAASRLGFLLSAANAAQGVFAGTFAQSVGPFYGSMPFDENPNTELHPAAWYAADRVFDRLFFRTKSVDTSSNQTAPLATVIRHDSLWKCRPPTRSEGALSSSEGCWGMGGVNEIGIALS